MNYLDNAWLIAIYPLVSAALIMFFTHKSRAISRNLSIGAVALGLLHSVMIFLNFNAHKYPHGYEKNFNWVMAGDFHLDFGYLVDHLTIGMLFTVCIVSLFVQIYTHGYMNEDEGYTRFYSYLSLFTFSMLGLVFATNLFEMYFFWELVGVCSFLLIGFWWSKPEAAHACKKAFIVNRVGDAGFLVGLIMLYNFTQEFWNGGASTGHDAHGASEIIPTLSFSKLGEAVQYAIQHNGLELVGLVSLTTIGLLVFMGAMAKSAQFPLHIWLPDAMEGPTPISALIHAATMVAAGVYLVVRAFPIYDVAGTGALTVIAWIGGFTAIFAATIALTQNDIKKALAYSTCSQLGYMIMAVGVGAPVIAMFHLMTHAAFKAMLFLGSGSVILACHHEQDMREMGGLRKHMPITSLTFLIGTLAISGMPLLSGYWSKDMIIAASLEKSGALFIIGTLTALLTAFYMFRMYFMTFEGEYRGHAHPQEQHWSVTLPLVGLAIPSVLLGLLGSPLANYKLQHYLDHHYHSHMDSLSHGGQSGLEFWLHELTQPIGFLPILMFVVGTAAAYMVYLKHNGLNKYLKENFKVPYEASLNKWYIDEVFDFIVAGFMAVFRWVWKLVEQFIIEGIFVNGIAWRGTEVGGEIIRSTQSGKVQNYALSMLIVMLVILLIVIF